MSRVKLSLPTSFPFSTTVQVRVTDLNYGNHLANDAIVSYLHVARIHLLESMNLSELNIGDGVSLIQGDLAVVYKSEGFLSDQIEIGISVQDLSNSSFNIVYRLFNSTQGKELAHAKTGMVCFNYDTRKVQPIPKSFRDRFTNQ